MHTLIITLISIALLVAISIATYLQTGFYEDKRAALDSVAVSNQANQIWGAAALYYTDKGTWPVDIATLVSGGYLRQAPVVIAGVEQTPSMVAEAWAVTTRNWELAHDDDGILTYLVLPESLTPPTCVATNLATRGAPIAGVGDMVKDNMLRFVSAARGLPDRTRELTAMPSQVTTGLVYQCVKETVSQTNGTFFWMVPKHDAGVLGPGGGGGGGTPDPVAACEAVNNYLARHGGTALTCSDEDVDAPMTLPDAEIQCLPGELCNICVAPTGAITVTIAGTPISWGSISGYNQSSTVCTDFGDGTPGGPGGDGPRTVDAGDLDCAESYDAGIGCVFDPTERTTVEGRDVMHVSCTGGSIMEFPGFKLTSAGGQPVRLLCAGGTCSADKYIPYLVDNPSP